MNSLTIEQHIRNIKLYILSDKTVDISSESLYLYKKIYQKIEQLNTYSTNDYKTLSDYNDSEYYYGLNKDEISLSYSSRGRLYISSKLMFLPATSYINIFHNGYIDGFHEYLFEIIYKFFSDIYKLPVYTYVKYKELAGLTKK